MQPIEKKEEGVIVIIVALLLPILIGFIGLTIDAGNILYHKNMLIEATEAAARSAIYKSYDQTIYDTEHRVVLDYEKVKSSTEEILRMNYDAAEVVEVTIVDESAVKLKTRVKVSYTFMKIFGYKEKLLEATQIVRGG
ncbi:MAG: pilus assembly protein [Clostridia bacterium]|nr:pilus assembly protein [Clostridia bacterium]